nr:hypothetical protein [uncultured Desulfobulbus sp.]
MKEKYTPLELDGITIWYQDGIDLESADCQVDIQGWWIFQELLVKGVPSIIAER